MKPAEREKLWTDRLMGKVCPKCRTDTIGCAYDPTNADLATCRMAQCYHKFDWRDAIDE